MMKIDLNDPIAVLVTAFQILERAGIETALYVEKEVASLADEIEDHDIARRWKSVRSAPKLR